jgi:hypothetical protein
MDQTNGNETEEWRHTEVGNFIKEVFFKKDKVLFLLRILYIISVSVNCKISDMQ